MWKVGSLKIAQLGGTQLLAELKRAKRACGAPWVTKSTHPRKFGNHVTVHRPPACPPACCPFVRTTGIPMFTLTQADCTSMLTSIDSCQNRVSADQYHLTVLRAQVSTRQGRVFFWSYPLRIYPFSNDRRLTFTFLKFISNMLCLCQFRPALLRFWFQTDLRRKNSAISF